MFMQENVNVDVNPPCCAMWNLRHVPWVSTLGQYPYVSQCILTLDILLYISFEIGCIVQFGGEFYYAIIILKDSKLL